jgi:hypothetical protein
MVNPGAAYLKGTRGADLAATGSATTTMPTNSANEKICFISFFRMSCRQVIAPRDCVVQIRACATIDAQSTRILGAPGLRMESGMLQSATESKSESPQTSARFGNRL